MPPHPEDDTGSLERARERLYSPHAEPQGPRAPLSAPGSGSLPHAWAEEPLPRVPRLGARHVRFASLFLAGAFVFFLIALAVAGYLSYFGGNSVSVDKVVVDIQGPATIAGGDTVPLSLTITNKNPVALENATIEIDFPAGTRSAEDVRKEYPHYSDKLGTIESGASVTRSIKAVVFGGAGQSLILPVSLSYGTAGSNADFVKKTSYALAISSTPLSISVDALTETVSGKPLTFTLTVRNNATVPLANVVLAAALPFGFVTTSSSLPLTNSTFSLGTLAPGASKELSLTGVLMGQDKEQRVFRFTVGTAKTANDQTLAVSYMTQDAAVTIAAPFINTTLALNGDTGANTTLLPGSVQTATISYTNTLPTSIANATVAVTLSGQGVDYASIQTPNGFYRSSDRTIIFSRDTDPALAELAPGASGLGTFSFATLPPKQFGAAPAVTFTISVSGTRAGQTNVPETVSASATKTVKVVTQVALTAAALHSGGPLSNSGPIPPRAEQATTYTVQWNVQNPGSTIAGGSMSTILPSYVSYTGKTAGSGSFSYDDKSRTVSWNTGDLAQGRSVQGAFQVSLTPSSSQKGSAPALTGPATFSGYDRYAGVQIEATADPVTTETRGDPGYVATNAVVQ